MTVHTKDEVLVLANVYAPNNDEPEFFFEVLEQITLNVQADHVIMGRI